MRFRPSLWLTVSSVIAFALLCTLGTWQMERRAWKTALIESIQSRADGAAVPLPEHLDDPDDWRFRRVTVTGRFRHDGETYRTGRAEAGRIGYRVFTPLIRPDGSAVMVERGWVPETFKDPAVRPGDAPEGVVTVTGVLRLPDREGWFTPAPDLDGLTWFRSDPVAMAKAGGFDAPPWYVVDEQGAGDWPQAGRPDFHMRNEHLNYAITWYSLAAVLLVIWLIMGFRRGKETEQ